MAEKPCCSISTFINEGDLFETNIEKEKIKMEKIIPTREVETFRHLAVSNDRNALYTNNKNCKPLLEY